jgi:hypothetical protein
MGNSCGGTQSIHSGQCIHNEETRFLAFVSKDYATGTAAGPRGGFSGLAGARAAGQVAVEQYFALSVREGPSQYERSGWLVIGVGKESRP